MIDYYQILGIPQSASDVEIKAAFKKKAVQFHPDKNDGDLISEEKFKKVNTAYQTLSNPYERARYDLKLKFGEQSIEYPSSPPPPYRRQPYHWPKRGQGTEKMSPAANKAATLWAFGLSLAIAIVVMTAMQLYDMYNQYQRDLMLSGRREIFDQARDYHASGQIVLSLSMIGGLNFFYDEEEDIQAFQENVLEDLLLSGTRKFYQNQFDGAIADLSIYEEFVANKRLSFEALLAECHMMAGNYNEAIARYNKIIINGNETIENYLRLAWMYSKGTKDYDRALSHYELAGRKAINSYKAIYGEAYFLILNSRNIPSDHFQIFHGMAETFFLLENYDRALSAVKWNALMWPDYPENYILRGHIFQMQGKGRDACGEFNTAIDLGWEEGVRCNG